MINDNFLSQLLFYSLAIIAVVSAVLMITRRNPVLAAIYLVLNFFCLGGLYLTLNAQFIAVIQVLVYAGAIMVLFLFVIMLLNLGDEQRLQEQLNVRKYIAVGLSIALLGELVYIVFDITDLLPPSQREKAIEIGTVQIIGKELYTRLLFPFEITAILLLTAIVGALILAKKRLEKNMIPTEHYLVLSAVLFIIGVLGVLVRSNAIVVFMSIELMLNSVNLTLVTFSAHLADTTGQMLVFFVMTVAAAEAAVGLAIIIALFRNKKTVDLEEINLLKW